MGEAPRGRIGPIGVGILGARVLGPIGDVVELGTIVGEGARRVLGQVVGDVVELEAIGVGIGGGIGVWHRRAAPFGTPFGSALVLGPVVEIPTPHGRSARRPAR